MKTMIIYASKTGHTKKIASAMGEVLGVTPKNISEKPVVENVDLLLIGTGVYAGKSSPKLIQFINTLDKNKIKKVILFSTCTSGEDNIGDLRELIIAKGIPLSKKTFVCKGQFLIFNRKHPNEDDVNNAKKFAKIIVIE